MPKLDVVFGPNGPYLKPGGVEGTSRVDVDTLNLMIQNAKVTGVVPLKDIEAAVPEKHVRFAELAEQFGKNVMALDAWVDQICTKHDNYQATKPYEKYILSRQVAYAQMLRDSLVRIDDELIGKLQAELTKLIAEEEEAKKAMAELCASSTPVTKSSLFSTDRLINFADGITRAAWMCFKYTLDAINVLYNSLASFFAGTARFLLIAASRMTLTNLLLSAGLYAGYLIWDAIPVELKEWASGVLKSAWEKICGLVALLDAYYQKYGWPFVVGLVAAVAGGTWLAWMMWEGLLQLAAKHRRQVRGFWKRTFGDGDDEYRGPRPRFPHPQNQSQAPPSRLFNAFNVVPSNMSPATSRGVEDQFQAADEKRVYDTERDRQALEEKMRRLQSQERRRAEREAYETWTPAMPSTTPLSTNPLGEVKASGTSTSIGSLPELPRFISQPVSDLPPPPPVLFAPEAVQFISELGMTAPQPPAQLSTALVTAGSTAITVLSQPSTMSTEAFEYLKVQLTSVSFLFTICLSVYASSALAPSLILANTFLAGFQFVTRNALIDAADKMMGLNKTSPWYPLFRLALTIPIGAAVTGSFSTVRLIGPAAAAARAYISPREVAEVTQEAGRFLGAGFDPVQDRPAFIATANQLGGYVAQMPPIFTPPLSSTSSVLDSIPKDVVTETKEGTIGLITTKLADIFKSTANLVKEATVGSESDNDLRKELVVTLTRANETVASAVTQEQLAEALEKAKTALVVWTGKTQVRSSDYLDAMSRFAGKTLSAVEAVMTLAATARMRA